MARMGMALSIRGIRAIRGLISRMLARRQLRDHLFVSPHSRIQ